MFLISIKLNKCVKKIFQRILKCCNPFLIATKHVKGFHFYPYALEYVLYSYVIQEMYENVVDTYSSALMLQVSKFYKTGKLFEKAVDTRPFHCKKEMKFSIK